MKRRKEKLLLSSSAVPIMQMIRNKSVSFVITKLKYNCGTNKETHFFCETRTVECVVWRMERLESASA